MSKADAVRALALSLVGQNYHLGEEPWFVIGPEQTKERLDTDCSGLPYGVFRNAGVLVNGRAPIRMTAHGLYMNAMAIPAPTEVGDLGFLLRNGRCYHTFMYVGFDDVVEAGDGTGHVGLRTVAHENARGARWGRLSTDIGELTEEDMTPEEHNILVDLRYMVAQKASYTAAISNALLIGDKAKAKALNDHFWQTWPEGDPGLPKGWTP